MFNIITKEILKYFSWLKKVSFLYYLNTIILFIHHFEIFLYFKF